MQRTLRLFYVTVIVNLFLWLATFGAVMAPHAESIKPLAIAGLVFSLVGQHWGYYALRKAAQAT